MRLFAFSVFLSAFLLFQVQPIIGRALLPWFGGTAAVWTTCLVFFQTLLLLGYLYAHLVIRSRRQVQLHIALLVLAAASLAFTALKWGAPLRPAPSARLDADPILEAGWLMAASVGLPYFALSSTGPLLQAWLASTGQTPYRLYALSSLGSLVGLLAYPFVVEPLLGLRSQGWLWAAGFLAFAGSVGLLASRQHLKATAEPAQSPARAGQLVYWTALAAAASLMLLAATQHLGEVIAVLPFLWVLPLALYLFTFVLCFDSDRWYRRGVVIPLLGLTLVVCSALLFRVHATHPVLLVIAYCAAVFFTAMTCHGELARSRPPPAQLTSFYLALSLGGALGGAFVSLVAPRVFKTNVEIDLAIAGAWLAALAAELRDSTGRRARAAMALALMPLVYVLGLDLADFSKRHPKESSRSFFGVISVRPMPGGRNGHFIEHGGIIHGNQLHDEAMRRVATAYYGPSSGVSEAVNAHPRRRAGEPLRIGVVGLGVGVIAAYGHAGDTIRFYEINPDVLRYAQDTRYFTYLADSPASIEHALGDARRSMEDELAAGHPGNFDVLVLDAFSGHAMPTHLLTKESFDLYAKMLRDDRSVIALLSPAQASVETVLHRVAIATGFSVAGIVNSEGVQLPEYASVWILFAKNRSALELPRAQLFVDDGHLPRLWTDDYVNLLTVLKWTIK